MIERHANRYTTELSFSPHREVHGVNRAVTDEQRAYLAAVFIEHCCRLHLVSITVLVFHQPRFTCESPLAESKMNS